MQRLFFPGKSLIVKLVLAFILVAVPPMLIASQVAATLVNNAVNANMEHWMRGLSQFVFHTLEETEIEINAVYTLIKQRFAQKEISFTPEEIQSVNNLDVDFVVLEDTRGNVLFSSHPGIVLDEKPLFPGSSFRWTSLSNGVKGLAIVVTHELEAEDGEHRTLQLGGWFSVQLAGSSSEDPIEIRLLLAEGEKVILAYSSLQPPPYNFAYAPPGEALNALQSGAADYFIPDSDWTDNTPNEHYLFKAIRDDKGAMLAIAVIAARMIPLPSWLPSARELFWGFFILGTILSGCAGYVLARRIGRPIRMLNQGVQSIAAGNLDYQVEVKGEDEVADLGKAFNLMAKQLGVMRHENIKSARQERSRMLGEVALGFAHEIRNPLVVIKTSAELVHNKMPKENKDARLLGFVVEEVGRIDSLITEFLSFAKPAPLKLDNFHLSLLANEILEICAAECGRLGITCTLKNEAEDDSVLGDENQIRQVLLNLILNALEAMPDGGGLDIRLFENAGSNSLCCEVRDTGTGIAKELLHTIHMPFISSKKSGLGLGLAKVHAILDEHGGNITCSSELGRGTSFTFCLNR